MFSFLYPLSMMIPRVMQRELGDAAREYPVSTVLGPRQSGKTTLVRMTFPDAGYRLLENPDTRLLATEDPRGFLAGCPSCTILDEIQRVPELLSYIQGLVDENSDPGQFILTGSHQPELHQAVSQTLPGRTAVMHLLPFSFEELKAYDIEPAAFELCLKGGYPRVWDRGLDIQRFYSGYLQTYLERDVRALMSIRDLGRFQTFLRLLAGRIGQVLNLTSLGNDAGVSSTTIRSWIEVLKASFVIYELKPFFENVGKRVIKSPKIYFTDTGLACFLLGIHRVEQVERDPLRGGIYENLIIAEVLKKKLNHGRTPDLYFFRDSHGSEIDLVVPEGRLLHPVEIKSAMTFSPEFLKGIRSFSNSVGDRLGQALVIYNGTDELDFRGVHVMNPLLHGGFDLDT